MIDHIVMSASEGVLSLVLARPGKHNAISLGMLEQLIRNVERFASDPALRVLHLSAQGDTFCAGGDFAGGVFPDLSHSSPAQFREWAKHGNSSLARLCDFIAGLEKPTVVSHQGPCIGGGLELSLAFNFRIASEQAVYSLPELGFGVTPSGGSIIRLTRMVGPQWARWLHVAGQRIKASKAEAIGLVHAVHTPEALEAEVQALCRKLAAQPVEASALANLAINLCAEVSEATGRNIERLTASALVFGPEYQERMASLMARFGAPS